MATVYDNFLTEEECDYILGVATPLMEPAMLVNSEVQKHRKSKSRTSHGAFMDSFQDPLLAMITHRIAHVARVPPRTLSPSGINEVHDVRHDSPGLCYYTGRVQPSTADIACMHVSGPLLGLSSVLKE
jgi:hypothetical protein